MHCSEQVGGCDWDGVWGGSSSIILPEGRRGKWVRAPQGPPQGGAHAPGRGVAASCHAVHRERRHLSSRPASRSCMRGRATGHCTDAGVPSGSTCTHHPAAAPTAAGWDATPHRTAVRPLPPADDATPPHTFPACCRLCRAASSGTSPRCWRTRQRSRRATSSRCEFPLLPVLSPHVLLHRRAVGLYRLLVCIALLNVSWERYPCSLRPLSPCMPAARLPHAAPHAPAHPALPPPRPAQ